MALTIQDLNSLIEIFDFNEELLFFQNFYDNKGKEESYLANY